ncbi:hypothetical protein [Brevundimonas fluminis]|jgi:hypothetical protein|uniref:hypothetical protein n=1 Tax=Brevundimonas fluminis TaxID=2487274 RepID=UPI000F6564CA|nr:hypothetical protein [Brevundimonas fluminis]
MKTLLIASLAAGLLGSAGTAAAQPASELNGTYLFGSPMTRLNSGALGQLSGVMEVRPNGEGRYHVSLSTIERIDDGATQRRSWSLQSCDGRNDGNDVVLTCELLNGTPGYVADNFRLRYAEWIRWEGELISADTYRIDMFYHSR